MAVDVSARASAAIELDAGRQRRDTRRMSVSFRPEPVGEKRNLPPPWLHNLMSFIYPVSLGLLEGVTQILVKALVAWFAHCSTALWPVCCVANPWTWIFMVMFSVVGLWTIVWLKVVYTRFELTLGLPIEYGTVQVASVLGGLFFYQEAEPMLPQPWRLPTIFAGLFIILVGVALSSQKQFPWESKR